MNLIAAIKSGKRFRQKSKGIWLEPKEGRYFSIDHILAEDWEIDAQKHATSPQSTPEKGNSKALPDLLGTWFLGGKL